MDSISLGSSLFLIGTIGLSIPSLLSNHYLYLNLKRPPLTTQFIMKHLFLSYNVSSASILPSIQSPVYTFITHMFHHIDIHHFIGNMSSILTSVWYLDLGFVKTCILFLAGGLTGVVANISQVAFDSRNSRGLSEYFDILKENLGVQRDSSFYNALSSGIKRVDSTIQGIPRTIMVYGSSAGAYALLGAHFVCLIVESTIVWSLMKQSFRRGSRLSERNELYKRFSCLIVAIGVKVLSCAGQIFALLEQRKMNEDIWSIFTIRDNSIGHSAHLGGFLCGVVLMLVFN